jgi:exodeoxyribonuclease-5/deoxyribonuclease V
MILAFDSYYFDNKAKTVCVQFENWTDENPVQIYSEVLEDIAEYEPGAFYKRELPCILSLLQQINTASCEAIVVDGFVFLDDELKPGLGAHLYERLSRTIPVIGVAKTNFATLHREKISVLRGESEKPLFVTAIGFNPEEAAAKIASMHGEYRIPSLLKLLDSMTKE